MDLPGWVHLPNDLGPADRGKLVDEVVGLLKDLIGDDLPDGTPISEAEIRAVLEAGLDARAESESYALYLVWPVMGPAAVMCHVNRVRTEDLPDWSTLDGRLYAARARHIGPGLQYSTRRTVDTDEGPVELSSVHFVFGDERDGIMINLEESYSSLIAQALVGLSVYMNALAATREDGSRFTSTAPPALIPNEDKPSNSEA